MQTESQLRLDRNLSNLFGGRVPHKQWTLSEVIDQLIECKKTTVSFKKIEGVFTDRHAPDSLVAAGFKVVINPSEPSATISW